MEESVDRSQLSKGEYANHFEIGHDFVAFYLDCGQTGDAQQSTKLYNRIIMSPIAAERLSNVLAGALDEYVRRFGALYDEAGTPVREATRDEQ
jgi:hypothetical protein